MDGTKIAPTNVKKEVDSSESTIQGKDGKETEEYKTEIKDAVDEQKEVKQHNDGKTTSIVEKATEEEKVDANEEDGKNLDGKDNTLSELLNSDKVTNYIPKKVEN